MYLYSISLHEFRGNLGSIIKLNERLIVKLTSCDKVGYDMLTREIFSREPHHMHTHHKKEFVICASRLDISAPQVVGQTGARLKDFLLQAISSEKIS
jgi:hypothetical protein